MEYETRFVAPGRPEDVIVRFTDIERMARCMPGAAIEALEEDGTFIGVMTVSFGPKRIAFKGQMTCEFDLAECRGVLRGRGAAAMRAARVAMETTFRVTADPDAEPETPASIVTIHSVAELGGVIADFAKTGGVALANVLVGEFARNLADDLARGETDDAIETNRAVSARKVLWQALRQKWRK